MAGVILFEGAVGVAGVGSSIALADGFLVPIETDDSEQISTGALIVGSVAVSSDQPMAGVILFGGSVGVAGVGSSLELSNGFVGPIEQDPTKHLRTGFAISNLDTRTVSVKFELCNANSEVLAAAQKTLLGNGHMSLFVDELDWNPAVDLAIFQGLLKITASGKTTAMILQTRPGQFATMPVAPIPGQP